MTYEVCKSPGPFPWKVGYHTIGKMLHASINRPPTPEERAARVSPPIDLCFETQFVVTEHCWSHEVACETARYLNRGIPS